MAGKNENRWPISIFCFLCAGILASCSSCSDDDGKTPECRNIYDCSSGERCIYGHCVGDTQTSSDTGTETATADSSSDTAVSTDSDTGEHCTGIPTLVSGQACLSNCDCTSGNCNNGFCCDSGICCGGSGDCPANPCATSHCISSTCMYTYEGFECGVTTVGTTGCAAGNVCDGAGNCVAAVTDCAPYTASTDVPSDCSVSPAQLVCHESCTAVNAAENCAAGNVCQDGKCVAPAAKADGSTCTTNNDCLSGHCSNDVCCADGECCATSADCDDMCVATVACSPQYQCVVTGFTGCGKLDDSGNATCNADGKRCNGQGQCIVAEACRTENGIDTYGCYDGRVVQNCQCEHNDDCDADTEFCNDGYLCDEGICNFRSEENPCPANPCRPDVSCEETQRQCTVGTSPCAAVATTCDPKSCVTLGDTEYECISTPVRNGTSCDDDLGCNGTADLCMDGECVGGVLSAAYCYDDNPCGPDYNCVENGFGQEPSCEIASSRSVGDTCSPLFSCFGSDGTCQIDPVNPTELICLQGEDMCTTNGICAVYSCQEDYSLESETGTQCIRQTGADDVTTLTCDTPSAIISLTDGRFLTRSYFDYNAACNPGNDRFIGMETRVILDMGQAVTDATLTVTDVDSGFAGTLEILLFDSNPCDEANCISRGTGSLTFSSSDGYETAVLDSTDALWPPESVTLQLDCNL